MILSQTGNVLSNDSVFTVNNIEVNKNSFKNKAELIDIAFKQGFEKLNKKILLEKDFNKLKNTNLGAIKNLVSHYQMTNDSELSENSIMMNLFFKRDKMYNFYSINNIKYSDVRGKNIKSPSTGRFIFSPCSSNLTAPSGISSRYLLCAIENVI